LEHVLRRALVAYTVYLKTNRVCVRARFPVKYVAA